MFKNCLIFCVSVLFIVLASSCTSMAEGAVITHDNGENVNNSNLITDNSEINWIESWDEGFDAAKKADKKVFLLITAPDWCHWCTVLEKNALADSRVVSLINEHFIAVKILDTNEADMAKINFNFGGYPTMAFQTKDQKMILKIGGAVSADVLIQNIEKALDYELFLQGLEDEFNRIGENGEAAKNYVKKLMNEELYDMVADKGTILYENGAFEDLHKEYILFQMYVSKLIMGDLLEAVNIAEEYAKEFPKGENIEIVMYYNIVCYYHLGEYEMIEILAEEFKAKFPESTFIQKINEILSNL